MHNPHILSPIAPAPGPAVNFADMDAEQQQQQDQHQPPQPPPPPGEGAADGVQADNDNDPPAQGGAPGDGHGGNGGNASSVSLSDREHISSIAFRLPSLQLPKFSGTNTECIKTYFDEVESLGRIYKWPADHLLSMALSVQGHSGIARAHI